MRQSFNQTSLNRSSLVIAAGQLLTRPQTQFHRSFNLLQRWKKSMIGIQKLAALLLSWTAWSCVYHFIRLAKRYSLYNNGIVLLRNKAFKVITYPIILVRAGYFYYIHLGMGLFRGGRHNSVDLFAIFIHPVALGSNLINALQSLCTTTELYFR